MKAIIKLRRSVEKSGLKKSFIASQFGMSNSDFSRFLSGERPFFSKRDAIFKFFGISE
jgi:transcriptional regulator with XRE-family HTH domain